MFILKEGLTIGGVLLCAIASMFLWLIHFNNTPHYNFHNWFYVMGVVGAVCLAVGIILYLFHHAQSD